MISRFGSSLMRSSLPDGEFLDAFLVMGSLNNPLHEDSGCVNGIGLQIADGNQMLYFGDRHAGCCGHDGIKVSRRLSVKEISPFITLPGLNKSEVCSQAAFEDVHPAIEFARFLIF